MLCLAFYFPVCLFAADSTAFIRLNLLGYTIQAPKKALIIAQQRISRKFQLYSVDNKSVVPLKPLLTSSRK